VKVNWCRVGEAIVVALDPEQERGWDDWFEKGRLVECLAALVSKHGGGVLELVVVGPRGREVFRSSTCPEVVAAELPESIRGELAPTPLRFKLEMAWRWLTSDEADRADMTAFCDSGGPEQIRQLHLRQHEGVPTANELEQIPVLDEDP